MKVSELIAALEEFQTKLTAHQELLGKRTGQRAEFSESEKQATLQEQSRWLSRRCGALRPYIERFDDQWMMQHPAAGSTWDALDVATSLTGHPAKGQTLRHVLPKLHQILGHLENIDPNEEIPADPTKPIRLGLTSDRIILAYLDHLHPFITRGCATLYRDGHYPQAVEEAVKAVFQYLRDKTGLTGDGAPLAQAAFSLKKPVLVFSDLSDQTKQNEQVGFMEMLAAFARGVRHPLTHTHGRSEEAQKAFEYLVMASLLCRRLDDATPKSSAP
jgi:uncharacterized protein (TIGR02391 family)